MFGSERKVSMFKYLFGGFGPGRYSSRLLVFLAFVHLEIKSLASNSNQCVANTKWGIVVVVTKESHCLTTRM